MDLHGRPITRDDAIAFGACTDQTPYLDETGLHRTSFETSRDAGQSFVTVPIPARRGYRGGTMKKSPILALAVSATLTAALALPANATHSWGGYHWGRSTTSFTLKLGDNVVGAWDGHLATASSDWSVSSVLDTTIVGGTAGNVKRCRPATGRVEVCNTTYGFTGWLGIAGITVSGGHITSGYVKLNDSYFNTATYNTPAWRLFVTCQEIGHTLGLNHTDETFDNPNQGTCMDYTSNPEGPPSNEHPFAHDYEQLVTTYGHADTTTTVGSAAPSSPGKASRSRVENVDKHGNGTVTWILSVT